ncbi:SH3 domain-containing protein [Poseidonocella pacifica]
MWEKLTAPNPESYRTLYVTGSVVNVRRGPSTAYARLFQLRKGQAVKELETKEGWTKLSSDSRSGWMSAKYLSPSKPIAAAAKPSTKRAPQCHPNYSGACVPIASDVDCAGGRGDGPAYVRGPVRVVGRDVYRLDRDRDGIGCE